MHHYLYRMINATTGEYYIGIRQCRRDPMKDHHYRGSGVLIRKKDRAHPGAFEKQILVLLENREEALATEARFVTEQRLRDPLCLNLGAGGRTCRGNLGHSWGPEARAKMSLSKRGNKSALGCRHPHTEEAKKKISAAFRGKSLTEEHRHNLSRAMMGNQNGRWKGVIRLGRASTV